jgi:hypothetical protein
MTTKNYVKKDESVYEAKNPGMGHLFPWVAVIFSKEGRFTMSFPTEQEAKEAAELWGKS